MIAAAKKYNYGNECEVCGKKFPRGVYKRACSGECKKALQWTRWNCVVCGKEMHTQKSQATKGGTCSIECGLKLRSDNNPPSTANCETCGKLFLNENRLTFCSIKCRSRKQLKLVMCKYCGIRNLRSLLNSKGRRKGLAKTCGHNECIAKAGGWDGIERVIASSVYYYDCSYCDVLFAVGVNRGHASSQCCSTRCRNRYQKMVRKMRMKCIKVDRTVTLPRVVRKYFGKCCGCGVQVRTSGDCKHREYASIDHVMPISKGGQHVWENVQLMCLACNLSKGAKVDATRPARALIAGPV